MDCTFDFGKGHIETPDLLRFEIVTICLDQIGAIEGLRLINVVLFFSQDDIGGPMVFVGYHFN